MRAKYVHGNVHNTATGNGGGVYLSASELNCQQQSTIVLINNAALNKGGGYAINLSIMATSSFSEPQYTGAKINFTGNTVSW